MGRTYDPAVEVRVTTMSDTQLGRGRFLRLAGASGAAAATVAGAAARAEAAPEHAAPELPVARLRDLHAGKPVTAAYPDAKSPIIVLKLGHAVEDGVGPERDIVAYSSFCTHMGCPVTYKPERKLLACPCHFSSFDPAHGGLQIVGQASTNLPQIVLEARGENVYAVGIRGLIWGRQSNAQRFS
jgi:arsenite oxidase small subunit